MRRLPEILFTGHIEQAVGTDLQVGAAHTKRAQQRALSIVFGNVVFQLLAHQQIAVTAHQQRQRTLRSCHRAEAFSGGGIILLDHVSSPIAHIERAVRCEVHAPGIGKLFVTEAPQVRAAERVIHIDPSRRIAGGMIERVGQQQVGTPQSRRKKKDRGAKASHNRCSFLVGG